VLILQPAETPRFVRAPIKMSPRPLKLLSLADLEQTAVNPRVVAACREASQRLSNAGVRHAVIGAIAVGIYGWARATRDVDLLVAPEAWETHGDGSQIPRVELAEQICGVDVDYLPIDVAGAFLVEAFDRSFVTEGVPIAPIEAVILTKLIRLAMRDQADVVELLKAGLFDAAAVEQYLDANAAMLTGRFRALVEQATRERERERES
jgi:hypothetical protein